MEYFTDDDEKYMIKNAKAKKMEVEKLNHIWKILLRNENYEDYMSSAISHNLNLIYEKAIQELQGIAFAIEYDKKLSNDEIKMLLEWMMRNVHFSDEWPISRVSEHFMELSEKREVTEEWRAKMLEILSDIKCGRNVLGFELDELKSSADLAGKICCVTGTFQDRKREEVHELLAEYGAIIGKTACMKTDYLFVGSKGAIAWRFSGFGRKIETALELRKQYGRLKICMEENLLDVLSGK